jgi:hypothetical protein
MGMRILFLCGCLEPGHDGVGDYTRRLGAELVRQGNEVLAIAIMDKFSTEELQEEQPAENTLLSVIRIPRSYTQDLVLNRLSEEVTNFRPDWISLQFVPFSFHPKGLPLWMINKLKTCLHGYPLHIMFHELWVGINGHEKLKMKMLGMIQKLIIKTLIRKLKPACITTTIPIYKKFLGIETVQLLPLIGNIPLVPNKGLLRAVDQQLQVVHFGTFTAALAEFTAQLEFLIKGATAFKKNILFLAIGNGGTFAPQALSVVKNLLGTDAIKELGRLSAEEISLLFQQADIGISRANFLMAGKSGTTVAMLEHGLPVVLRGHEEDVKIIPGATRDELLLFCDSQVEAILMKTDAKNTLAENAALFTSYLLSAEIEGLG